MTRMLRMTEGELTALKLGRKAKPSKYGNVPAEIDGIVFDSKAEAKRYQLLKLREVAREIWDLQVHTRWPLVVSDLEIGAYESDFCYWENGRFVVEDVKGAKTPIYRWKKKHFEAQYHFELHEVRA